MDEPTASLMRRETEQTLFGVIASFAPPESGLSASLIASRKSRPLRTASRCSGMRETVATFQRRRGKPSATDRADSRSN